MSRDGTTWRTACACRGGSRRWSVSRSSRSPVLDGAEVIGGQPHRAVRPPPPVAAGGRPARAASRSRSPSCSWPPGSRSSGVCSLEDAERRSTLVGQLRFAATLQDLRTVVLLRRQLALELPRKRPVDPAARARHRPAAGLRARACGACCAGRRRASPGSCLLAVVAGARAARRCGRAPRRSSCSPGWPCSSPASTAVEPLAQEVDHPSRRDAVAPRGRRDPPAPHPDRRARPGR